MVSSNKQFCRLFSPKDDKQFESFEKLLTYCRARQRDSEVYWRSPAELLPMAYGDELRLKVSGSQAFDLNDWSFGQVCELANVKKETINRLKADTASRVLMETFPFGSRPYQVYTYDGTACSVHRVGFTRLFDAELLEIVVDEAFDYNAPPNGCGGTSGMYAGEQDMFAFFIDETAWVEIGDEQFAPGFFVWNSEVGRRMVGIQSFWFQRGCGNHIVWDANGIVYYGRKHTANVKEALTDIRLRLKHLVQTKDARKDAFYTAMAAATKKSLGSTPEDLARSLSRFDLGSNMIQESVKDIATSSKAFTLFNTVDSLTRISGRIANPGNRNDLDCKIGKLLTYAA